MGRPTLLHALPGTIRRCRTIKPAEESAAHPRLFPFVTAWVYGDAAVESLNAIDIGEGLLFAANHRSTSDRSHPPETCLPGNRPLLVQRKRVDRFTPTTRRTSAVLILWSSGASRSGLGMGEIVVRVARREEPPGPKRRGSWRGRAAPSRFARRRGTRAVSFERRMGLRANGRRVLLSGRSNTCEGNTMPRGQGRH